MKVKFGVDCNCYLVFYEPASGNFAKWHILSVILTWFREGKCLEKKTGSNNFALSLSGHVLVHFISFSANYIPKGWNSLLTKLPQLKIVKTTIIFLKRGFDGKCKIVWAVFHIYMVEGTRNRGWWVHLPWWARTR